IAKNLYALLLEKSKAYYKETWKALTEYRTNFWICDKCVVSKDRTNASMNILKRGISARATEGHSGSQACGDNARPSATEAVAGEAGTIRAVS
ncbi:MAG: hypothetical protein QXT43_00720, partial [Candidatus Micrarchaeaceae archaeon]